MRLSCPSIDGIINVYQNWEKINDNFRKSYVNRTKFINDATLGECVNYQGKKFDTYGNIVNVNNSSKWHRYLYDTEDILNKLRKIGFSEYYLVKKHESEYLELQKIERRLGGKFVDFPQEIDLIVEAKK